VKNQTRSGHSVLNVSLRIGRTSLRANRGRTALGSPESKLTCDIAGPARGTQTDRMLDLSRHALDLQMPKKDGRQVVTELMSRRGSKPRIIVMTVYETEADIRQALKAGAKAFLIKAARPQQIREAVRRVAKGELPSAGDRI
jgi:DNA-binding NarL/FixJ family response regulator